jgi:uncharacterized protein (DUF952 family)
MWIVHICERQEWEAALKSAVQAEGEYRAVSLEEQGFIHASRPEQALETANRYYRGRGDLVLLWIDVERLLPELRWEGATGEIFPHIYGPLNLGAVKAAIVFPPEGDGIFRKLPRF